MVVAYPYQAAHTSKIARFAITKPNSKVEVLPYCHLRIPRRFSLKTANSMGTRQKTVVRFTMPPRPYAYVAESTTILRVEAEVASIDRYAIVQVNSSVAKSVTT
jgi:hypothetical protein